ncbi:MAG: serine hydrolase domain-containing protein, partial [Bacteroidota bacterium]
ELMTEWLLPLFALLFFSCNAPVKLAQNKQEISRNSITKAQSELIFETIKAFPNDTQFSIAIIKNDTVDFYGVKRDRDKIVNIDNHNRVFEIGSISKVLTSTLLASFVLEKKISLDASIGDHLGLKLNENQNITFKELANHTSGLPRLAQNRGFGLFQDSDNPYKNYGEDKLVEYLTEKVVLGEKEYAYSNIGAATLGYSMAKIGNTTYQELVERKIFSKYGMRNSSTSWADIGSKLVKGLNKDGEITPNWDMNVHVGAGGILSTSEDLAKFAIAQFDSTNLELALTREKTYKIKEGVHVGLGWHILKTEHQDEFITHNGGTGGYTSSIAVDLKNQNGMVVLSNVSAFHENYTAVVELCNELLASL